MFHANVRGYLSVLWEICVSFIHTSVVHWLAVVETYTLQLMVLSMVYVILQAVFVAVEMVFTGPIIFHMTDLSVCLELVDVFVRARIGATPLCGTNQWQGQRSLLPQLCLQTEVLYEKRLQQVFWGLTLDILILNSSLHSWHQFYLTAWGITTMNISSKCFNSLTKFWINCFCFTF